MNSLSRTRIRHWITLTALLLVATAILIIGIAAVNPALLGVLQHPRDDIFLVTGFLIAAIFAGALFLPMYLTPEDADTDAYEPEATPAIPSAGADIEPLTKNPLLGYRVTDDEQDAIQARLRDTAVNVIHRHTGIGTSEASTRVRRGDWTENAAAAWFLGETPPPRSVRLYARVSDDLAFRHGARQTIREIVAYEQRQTDTEDHT